MEELFDLMSEETKESLGQFFFYLSRDLGYKEKSETKLIYKVIEQIEGKTIFAQASVYKNEDDNSLTLDCEIKDHFLLGYKIVKQFIAVYHNEEDDDVVWMAQDWVEKEIQNLKENTVD